MLGHPLSQNTLLEPTMYHVQPFALVERYYGSGRRRREIGDFEAVLIHQPFWSPGDGEVKVIDLVKYDKTQGSEVKEKEKGRHHTQAKS
ncbi:hypothetical protein L6452_42431 [Arctium lappa]|uniref:Uncharacterized protein n=1 Tax=Arctium lappa TaxID=4217 RepID=A0ACB8XIM7_ARCLA|nr:hypothetical protein L6452_42431 [Arctium lappa]